MKFIAAPHADDLRPPCPHERSPWPIYVWSDGASKGRCTACFPRWPAPAALVAWIGHLEGALMRIAVGPDLASPSDLAQCARAVLRRDDRPDGLPPLPESEPASR